MINGVKYFRISKPKIQTNNYKMNQVNCLNSEPTDNLNPEIYNENDVYESIPENEQVVNELYNSEYQTGAYEDIVEN